MRSYANTAARDFKVVDAVEEVLYTAPRGEEQDVWFYVQFADAHDLSAQEIAASQGLFQLGDRRWGLGSSLFPENIEPQAGDQIKQEDGTIWEVMAGSVKDSFSVSWFVPSRRAR